MALSDELARKIGTSTGSGTKITQGTVDGAKADERGALIIRENNTEAIEKAMGDAILKGLEEIGLLAQAYAAMMCPVDTGRLRASITHQLMPSENAVYIGTNVSYAPVVELGNSTGRKAANGGKGFLRPAATEHAAEYRALIEKHLS